MTDGPIRREVAVRGEPTVEELLRLMRDELYVPMLIRFDDEHWDSGYGISDLLRSALLNGLTYRVVGVRPSLYPGYCLVTLEMRGEWVDADGDKHVFGPQIPMKAAER